MNLYGKKYSDVVINTHVSTKLLKEQGAKVFYELALSLGFERNESFEEFIVSYFEIEYFNRNDLIFDTVTVNKNIYLILNGVVEYYSKIDDQEMTILLLNDGNVCANSTSLLRDIPSLYYAKALKNTVMLKLNTLAFNTLLQSKYAADVYRFIELLRYKHEQYVTDFFLITRMPASVKTQKVMTDYYEIFRNVPQGKISEFLGIKPETFSRLKTSTTLINEKV